jgi:hypothetical protein
VIENVVNILDILGSIDMENIDGLTANMNTKFSTALKTAIDLKLKGSTFDTFESMVEL